MDGVYSALFATNFPRGLVILSKRVFVAIEYDDSITHETGLSLL